MPRQTEKQEACLVQSQLLVQTLETFFSEQWGEVTTDQGLYLRLPAVELASSVASGG